MTVPEIDVDDLKAALTSASRVTLIDVREPHELVEVRVPGVTPIPLGEVADRVAEVPTDSTVYVICRSGGRSAQAVEFYRSFDIDAVNVAGGTLAWVEAGNETESG